MCGIVGIIALDDEGKDQLSTIVNATQKLQNRGPDNIGIFKNESLAFGHSRLSIIDLSEKANQPFFDKTSRFVIVFNGEIYNYKKIRSELIIKGYSFVTESDTEVVLLSYIEYGENCLEHFNGFFSFAIWDKIENNIFLARDRMGIKPLMIYKDEHKIIFSSELKAISTFKIDKNINKSALYTYLQFHYIPAPLSIFENVQKVMPGNYVLINKGIITHHCYYDIPYVYKNSKQPNYETAKKQVYKIVEEAVIKRLVSDVPLGTFLSGGVDSSIISALSAKHINHLNTFSIGFKDEPFYDETHFAIEVSKKIKSEHTVFSITNDELYEHLFSVLDYLDEPFADSSALAVDILSFQTRKHVKVALSGDGADELFAGYNKHRAEYLMRYRKGFKNLINLTKPIASLFPESRNSLISNTIRQINRFHAGINLNNKERYWRWCSISSEEEVSKLLLNKETENQYYLFKENILSDIKNHNDFNEVLLTDLKILLPNDMLTKVDLMSMKNSLEVRVPFLDHKCVYYISNLPYEYKIHNNNRKMILKDTFKELLPNEILNRKKQGFEVPLLKWFKGDLKTLICDNLLEKEFILNQNIFDYNQIERLRNKLFSNNPGDSQSKIWGLIVFQYWWKKNMI